MKRKVSKVSPQIADAAIDDNKVGRKAVSLSALREQAAGLRRAQQMAGLAHVVTMPDGSFQSWSETRYLISKPVPFDELLTWLRQRR